MSELWWAYLLLGAFAGFMAGLLGLGGGGIMVPILTTIFLAEGFARSEVVHLALGTSMAAIVFTSISSLRAHHAHGAVLWNVVRGITPGILLGTFGATFLAARAPTMALTLFFAVFMSYVAVQMLLDIKPKPHRELPGTLGMSAVGVGIGGVSALVAIGGGTLSVPFMTWCNVKARHAIGTSAAIGLPIALAGTAGYLINGWGHPNLPPASFGFVYLPALVLVVVVSMATAPFGARLAHRLPVATLKRVFAGVLMLLVAKMLWGVFG
ncbi:MAG: sulfite exporter TauE/SafE family protein [Rhodocyclaceae bacterium]|nr:sulfite exporter TauE/SafE family protein [Rhodocyclaceae bacterium]